MHEKQNYTDSIFNNEIKKDYFNNIIISISSGLFDVQQLLSRYTIDMLQVLPDFSAELLIQLPVMVDGVPLITDCKKIFYDVEDKKIKIIIMQHSGILFWEQLDITAMDMIVNHLHTNYISQCLYHDLSKGRPQ